MASGDFESVATYTVGWIAVLDKELAAAMPMLDEEHEIPADFCKNPRDESSYTRGCIGLHDVALCSLPDKEYGLAAAAHTADALIASLPSICIGVLVGIGTDIPEESIANDNEILIEPDIRLGDVVVGTAEGMTSGVVQFDPGKVKKVDGKVFLSTQGS